MEQEKNHLYEISVSVKRGPSCPMLPNFIGAYVTCYVSAPDYRSAAECLVLKLKDEGYIFENIQGQIYELDPSKWQEYVDEKWSEFKDHFPTQEEIDHKVESGEIFYSPFMGYESN